MTNINSSHRIFIVDDHPLVREGLVHLIERQPGLSVCGEAEKSAAAFEAISRLKPDVAIVDLTLEGGGSGLELIKQLQSLDQPPQILVLSMHDEMLFAERAFRAGARGYIMKRSAPKYIIEAIHQLLQGKLYMSESFAMRMAGKRIGARAVLGEPPVAQLSDREMEVFRMLGEGCKTSHIAQKLHLSPKTVQVYCGRIKEKLNLANATELICEAVRWMESESRGEGKM
ncbi:MAG: response regulator transcription factor [Syntrophorhabdaceae bacterium]|nr:response regulator transcription factor [Syntrophorhabdaceae bacterium]